MKPRFYAEAIPLGATLGRVELEIAAALMLFALHELGRDWFAPVGLQEIGEVCGAALEAGAEPVRTWASNPFLRPDLAELESKGIVIRSESDRGPAFAFTPSALERLAPHLVPFEISPAMEARS